MLERQLLQDRGIIVVPLLLFHLPKPSDNCSSLQHQRRPFLLDDAPEASCQLRQSPAQPVSHCSVAKLLHNLRDGGPLPVRGHWLHFVIVTAVLHQETSACERLGMNGGG